MDNELWIKESFDKYNMPEWNCPICQKGLLKIVKDKFQFEETVESVNFHKLSYWEYEFTSYVFNGLLFCSNCSDHISFLGKGSVNLLTNQDNDGNCCDYEWVDVFYPVAFYPPLHLFKISNECPEIIKEEIISSFSLYWNDLPSCANKIRSALELIMNEQKVKKERVGNGKVYTISLHNRIEEFKIANPVVAEYLLAIKWIGNVGSHLGDLKRQDLIDAYQLLEYSLNKLYDDNERKLNNLSSEIIRNKGTRKII